MFRKALNSFCNMARTPPKKPVIAVVGATGTGKSQLAVELAKRFHGEIINSDAMQLYEGLPVITNKHPIDERAGIPHHLLGSIKLHEEPWTVTQFVGEALSVINDIHARGKVPILVGGTHYYIQSLLFNDSLSVEDETPDNKNPKAESQETFPILNQPPEIILAKLREVDPVMADRWHPNDIRKISASLEIYLRTGKTASQTYEEQRQRALPPDPHQKASLMRFPALILWPHASTETLRTRLDTRVDKMLAAGLLSEVASLHSFLEAQSAADKPVDRTHGIWVSIGYKEFEAYQRATLDPSASAADLVALKAEAVAKTQAATRQYARRQLRWIRIKLLYALAAAHQQDSIFLLDGTDLSRWEESVQKLALDLAERFLGGEELPRPQSLSAVAAENLVLTKEFDARGDTEARIRRVCEVCDMVCVTENNWTQHVQSRRHKMRQKKQRERRRREEGLVEGSARPVQTLEGAQSQSTEDSEHGDFSKKET
ncbi:tRNA isopentenyltransferase [Saccharata proteae CBS 121410]|uniref:tRNA dimethylallyltransferase n=1 Tax=Saccharata proteae CBS 121410 TaxID=1314787 RepID=A0A9P4HS55_9PEZI|nr:tRNA isopentenyltransferase [Saccharata proteae CBS 121410]